MKQSMEYVHSKLFDETNWFYLVGVPRFAYIMSRAHGRFSIRTSWGAPLKDRSTHGFRPQREAVRRSLLSAFVRMVMRNPVL